MEEKTITIKVEYDKNEGRIMVGDLILAKIYATKDGLHINTLEQGESSAPPKE